MGLYWIGDLCYVMNDAWDEVCELTTDHSSVKNGRFTLADGRKFALHTTAYGDGEYTDQYGNSYVVDAGIIGVIALADLPQSTGIKLGSIFEFDEFPTISYDLGTITIGLVEIDTSYED